MRALVGSFATGDSVRIGYTRSGSGPPLLLVHGGAADHRSFEPICAQLARRFTVTAYDRRGRGMSGDGDTYSLDQEANDFVAAAHVAGDGAPVAVIAHSFGGTVALRAICSRPAPVRALVAYEAPFLVPGILPALPACNALIAAGDHEKALRLFVRSTFHLPDTVVDKIASHPLWPVSVEAVPSLPRECAEVLRAQIEEPTTLVPPVRYLVAADGGNPAFREIAARLRRMLPGADVATVGGAPHFSIAARPVEFVLRAVEHLDRHPNR